MTIENPFPLFYEWIPWALAHWLLIVGAVAIAGVVISFIVSAVRRGPLAAAETVADQITQGAVDLARISPRRVLALAGLSFREAVRRRVVWAFGVFMVVLLFAVWFLDRSSPDPAKLYLTFVMNASTYLVLLLALFLSVFSLPNDITRRTIYTIVTKPVRASEIVLGRIIGFTAIGSIMLGAMGAVSYVFVLRELSHTHEVEVASLEEQQLPSDGEENPVERVGRTSNVQGHRHQVFLRRDGTGETDVAQGHWHPVRLEKAGGKERYVLGGPQGMVTARVPVYGKFSFRDRSGNPTDKGHNVGNEWTYREYVEGGTLEALVWDFQGLRAADFPEGLTVQMTLSVFRTHKGRVDEPVLGSIKLRNPATGLETAETTFSSKEFQIDEHHIPRELKDRQGNAIDLFGDLVADGGRLQVLVYCAENGQYFGAAQPDLYLLAREKAFAGNFFKGYLGIWLQMVLIVGIAVMFSTFLNSAVAMVATLASLVGGMLVPKILALLRGEVPGGGAFESMYRIVTHAPVTTDLDPGVGTTVIKVSDAIVAGALWVVTSLLPDLTQMDSTAWVAHGYDIPANDMAIRAMMALGYLIPLFVAGYFFLKTREVAK